MVLFLSNDALIVMHVFEGCILQGFNMFQRPLGFACSMPGRK